MQTRVVDLDIAKRVFQVHAADMEGHAVAQVKLRRSQVLYCFQALRLCLVGNGSCATAHY